MMVASQSAPQTARASGRLRDRDLTDRSAIGHAHVPTSSKRMEVWTRHLWISLAPQARRRRRFSCSDGHEQGVQMHEIRPRRAISGFDRRQRARP